MENLEIDSVKSTYFTPQISLNAASGACSIKGESYLEDTWDFYRPILTWLKQFCEEVKKPIHFTFNLTYYNTSSSKCFLDVVKCLKEYKEQGGEVLIDWFHPEDDDDIREEAEDYRNFLGIDINIVSY
jgi:hypothetical protein